MEYAFDTIFKQGYQQFWSIYLEKTIVLKDTCTPIFTAALFTVDKTWKQPKCPTTEEWKEKMWYIYTVGYLSAIKNKIMPYTATWMDLEIITLSEVRQLKTNVISLICGI